MAINEICEKYNIVLKGTERFYVESLDGRDYTLENCTPYVMLLDNHAFEFRSWGDLLQNLAMYLQENGLVSREKLLRFQPDWSKSPCVAESVLHVNMREVRDGLVLNVNTTAVHSVWMIQDLLKYAGIGNERCLLLIKRPSKVEPDEVRSFFLEHHRKAFADYLVDSGYSRERAEKVVKNVDTCSMYLKKTKTAYDDFILMDSSQVLSNCKSKFRKAATDLLMKPNQVDLAMRCLDLLSSYVKKANQEFAKANPNGVAVTTGNGENAYYIR